MTGEIEKRLAILAAAVIDASARAQEAQEIACRAEARALS